MAVEGSDERVQGVLRGSRLVKAKSVEANRSQVRETIFSRVDNRYPGIGEEGGIPKHQYTTLHKRRVSVDYAENFRYRGVRRNSTIIRNALPLQHTLQLANNPIHHVSLTALASHACDFSQ